MSELQKIINTFKVTAGVNTILDPNLDEEIEVFTGFKMGYYAAQNELKQQIQDAEEMIKELSASIGYKEEITKKYWEKWK